MASYQQVGIILNLVDVTGAKIGQGSAKIQPSVQLTDAADNLEVPTAPVWASLNGVAFPSVTVYATDSAGLLPSGWGLEISYPGVPGYPASQTFLAPAGPLSFTANDASPCVFTWTATSGFTVMPDSTAVQLSGGSLPAGFTAGTTYYVVNASAFTFNLAATVNGTPLASTGSGSGTLTVQSYFLSSLTPVSSVTTMAAYLPLPSGTPSSGQVPVATGSGEGSAWGTVSSGFANPMTTLGDTLYENATPAAARLAGDTSNARKFLRTQASGGVAQAPAWDTIQAGDISALALLRANNLADLSSIAAARETLAPWLFDVTAPAYGAVGDVQAVNDGAMSSSSNPTHLACTMSTPFKSGDVGKTIIINRAGNSTGFAPLITTIASFTDSGHVVLGAGASVTVSGAIVVWGTDDTTAFTAASAAAGTYLQTHLKATVYRPPPPNGIAYMIAGPLITTGGANAQVPIPNPSTTSGIKPTLVYAADPGDGTAIPYWTQTLPQIAGAVVSAGIWDNTTDYTNNYIASGPSCVFGSTPNTPTSGPNFANINVIFRDWSVVRPYNTYGLHYAAISLNGCAMGRLENCSALLTENYANYDATSSFQNGQSRGFILPANGNNDQAVCINPTQSGDAFAIRMSEHALILGGRLVGNSFAFEVAGGGHLMKIINASVEDTAYGFWIDVQGESGIGMFIDAEVDIEGLSAAGLIQDNSSGAGLASIFGEIRVNGSQALNIFPTAYPTSVKLISKGGNGGQVPGWVFGYAGFGTAGTTVAVQNPYWRDAKVYFSAGTITAVSAGATLGGSGGNPAAHPAMTATGLSGSGNVDWPAGGWLSFTFTGSPTWNVCVPT